MQKFYQEFRGFLVFIILLSIFVIRHCRGTCSSVEILKEYMIREKVGNPCTRHCVTVFLYFVFRKWKFTASCWKRTNPKCNRKGNSWLLQSLHKYDVTDKFGASGAARVEIGKLQISFALRCQWTRKNLPTKWSGTERHWIKDFKIEIIKIRIGCQYRYTTPKIFRWDEWGRVG